jgi:hypothetical protein
VGLGGPKMEAPRVSRKSVKVDTFVVVVFFVIFGGEELYQGVKR